MNGYDLRDLILKKRPKFDNARLPIVDELSNLEKSQTDYTEFGPRYQLFMYAFMMGWRLKSRIPLGEKKTDFLEIGKWNPRSLVEYILMILFSSNDLNTDWNTMEDMEENEVENVVRKLISIMEEYANGGLIHLENIRKNNKEEFFDPFVFVNLMKDVVITE